MFTNVIADEIRRDRDLAPAVANAAQKLEDLAGRTAEPTAAEWSRGVDAAGAPHVDLRISDFAGAVAHRFARTDLAKPEAVSRQLSRLWGDLLQARSHRLLDLIYQIPNDDDGE